MWAPRACEWGGCRNGKGAGDPPQISAAQRKDRIGADAAEKPHKAAAIGRHNGHQKDANLSSEDVVDFGAAMKPKAPEHGRTRI
jgi:hypothetical protein